MSGARLGTEFTIRRRRTPRGAAMTVTLLDEHDGPDSWFVGA
jgi:hypothetical protein